MNRIVRVAFVLTCGVIPLLIGCKKRPVESDEAYQLELTLPESRPAPEWARGRVPKLTVDGKEYAEPHRALSVRAASGNPTVKVVYSFWPNTYTNVIRTKM